MRKTKKIALFYKNIDCIKFCGAFELSLRRHDESEEFIVYCERTVNFTHSKFFVAEICLLLSAFFGPVLHLQCFFFV